LARLVVDSGLVTSPAPDFGTPAVVDAPTTTLTVVLDGTATTLSAPALHEARPDDPMLTPRQQQLRVDLRDLVARLGDLEGVVGADHLGPEEPYRPAAVWVQARPA